jgi:hypothetical protein
MININPAGTDMQPKILADEDTGERQVAEINNDNKPHWSKVKYGLDSLKETVTDANGVQGITINGETTITDMNANAKTDSTIAPAPNGATVTRLPGFQPDGTVNNTLALTLTKGSSMKAPRAFYTTGKEVSIPYYKSEDDVYKDAGNVSSDATSISVFQVPYGDDFTVDTTGIADTTSAAVQVRADLLDYLKKLDAADKAGKSGKAELASLLGVSGNDKSKISDLNNLINTGLYNKAYKAGLNLALGSYDSSSEIPVPLGKIKVSGTGNTVYDQFQFIYEYLQNGKGSGIYDPQLVQWAKKNATSILQVLMVNYMLQHQFPGTDMAGDSPMTLGFWGEESVAFTNSIKKAGKSTKEPFFLYCSFNGRAMKSSGDKSYTSKELPTEIDSKYMAVDLSYVFHLYSAIMFEVWQGTDAKGFSETWKTALKEFDSQMSGAAKDKTLPDNAHKVSLSIFPDSVVNTNGLAYGLSSYSKTNVGVEAIYGGKKDIVASLRILLSRGEDGAAVNTFRINDKDYNVTPISTSKRNQSGTTTILNQNKMYNDFKATTGDAYNKYKEMLVGASKIEEYPATFNSHWDGDTYWDATFGSPDAPEYVFMPSMLGGSEFVTAVTGMVNSLTNKKDSEEALPTLSFANRYIILYNFKPNDASMTDNTTGLRRVEANANTGAAKDLNKPIVITGYNSGESFLFSDYMKTEDLLAAGKSPTITAKNAKGETIRLDHLNLTKQFFTLNSIKDIIGAGSTGELTIDSTLQSGYKTQYGSNSSSPVLQWVSPNYNTFFDAPATDWGGKK